MKSVETKAYKKMIEWLKKQRKQKFFTMRSLAKELKVAHSYIGKTEQCLQRLDALELVVYCKALGVDPKEAIDILAT
jgi:transcriptional regulator with XRE-family HTH domain